MRKVFLLILLLLPVLSAPAFAQDAVSDVVLLTDATDMVAAAATPDVVADAPAVVAGTGEAPAPVVEVSKQPETDEEAVETIGLLVAAGNAGAWPIMVGFIIMVLVWTVRRFALKTLSEKWTQAIPWVAAGLGILSCVGISLANGNLVWWKALLEGIVSGVLASGLWELIGKKTLKASATVLPTVGESSTK